MGKNQSHLTRKKGGFNLSHLKNSIDGKMVGSVAVVVSVNGSTCHRALKVDHGHAGHHELGHDHDDHDGRADDDDVSDIDGQ